MSKKVLFVDDDPKILKGISRQFDDELDFETAIGPEEALELLDSEGPFAVVVSDMRMPKMTGVELLSVIRQRSPNTVRMMLTGFADLESTILAVNEGNIYRFLSKPCSHEVLEKAVHDGLEQYRLVNAEKELLEGTLHGSIKVLSEMLSLVNPLAFGRTSQVQRIAMAIGKEMEVANLWDLKIASLLFPLGCVTVSETALECVLKGDPVPAREESAFCKHSEVARQMLSNIPRLETVAEIVLLQDKGYDGSGLPKDKPVQGEEIILGARILKVASDFEIASKKATNSTAAVDLLRNVMRRYDPKVITALESALRNGLCQSNIKEYAINRVTPGMVLASDLRGSNGQLLVAKGQTISQSIQTRLLSLLDRGAITDVLEIEVLGEVTASSESLVS